MKNLIFAILICLPLFSFTGEKSSDLKPQNTHSFEFTNNSTEAIANIIINNQWALSVEVGATENYQYNSSGYINSSSVRVDFFVAGGGTGGTLELETTYQRTQTNMTCSSEHNFTTGSSTHIFSCQMPTISKTKTNG